MWLRVLSDPFGWSGLSLNGWRARSSLWWLFLLLLAGCATPYVQPPTPWQVSPALHQASAIMDDGYRLPLSRWVPKGERRVTLLTLHGLNDYRQAFDTTGEYLAQQGIEVIAYDQRGFGESDGHGLWHGSGRLIEDLRMMIELLRASNPERPLFLLGESMGGAVILAAGNGGPLAVDGVILVAPAVWSRDSMPYYQRWALWLMAHLAPSMELTGKGLDLHPSDNIEMLRALGRDPLVIKATRVDVLYGVSNLMDRAVQTETAPAGRSFILYGQHDDIIPWDSTCRWLLSQPGASSQVRQTLIYRNGYHMLTRDLQAEVVLEDIADWILGDGATQGREDLIGLHDFCETTADGG
jgi:alpha-beta hydrolase superfamily lysophospholipase